MGEIVAGLMLAGAVWWLCWWHDRHGPDKEDR